MSAGVAAPPPDLLAFLPGLTGGGAERVVLQLLGDFTQRGLRCELAVAAGAGELDGAVPATVPTVRFGRAKAWHAVPALRRHLARRRPRALLSSILSANLAAVTASWGLRTRCVVREASTPTRDTAGRSPRQWANRVALRRLYSRADAVVALADSVARDLERLGVPRHRITVIPNPPLEFGTTAACGPAPPAGPYLLACGRLEPQKDPATLVRAFARLAPRHPALELVILGEGSLRGALIELAQGLGVAARLRLPGFVTQPQPWYRGARAFVHAARWEGFPNAVVEALASSLAVVAVDSDGAIRQVVDDGRFGTLVAPGNDAALAAGVDAVLNGERTFPDASAHLRQFDRAQIVQRYIDLLFPPAGGRSG